MKTKKIWMFAYILCTSASGLFAQKYIAGDFHQHTTYTDGSYTMGYMMEKSNEFGLDWWANSEHGGSDPDWGLVTGIDMGASVQWKNTSVILQGKENNGSMWRWQALTDWSFRDVLLYRRIMPEKLIIQGYEYNVPGHEHASMAIIANQFNSDEPNVLPLAQFEYLWDKNDKDDSQPFHITETKNVENDHLKAVLSIE